MDERAGDGIRTRDPQLGRLMLYQLSYSRGVARRSEPYLWAGKDSNLRTRMRTDLQSVAFNHSATCPGISARQESASLRSLSRRQPGELAKGLEPPTC